MSDTTGRIAQRDEDVTYRHHDLDWSIELLARIFALGLLDGSDLEATVEDFVNSVNPHALPSPRCPVCASLLEIESWDVPVEHCPYDCEVDSDE